MEEEMANPSHEAFRRFLENSRMGMERRPERGMAYRAACFGNVPALSGRGRRLAGRDDSLQMGRHRFRRDRRLCRWSQIRRCRRARRQYAGCRGWRGAALSFWKDLSCFQIKFGESSLGAVKSGRHTGRSGLRRRRCLGELLARLFLHGFRDGQKTALRSRLERDFPVRPETGRRRLGLGEIILDAGAAPDAPDISRLLLDLAVKKLEFCIAVGTKNGKIHNASLALGKGFGEMVRQSPFPKV